MPARGRSIRNQRYTVWPMGIGPGNLVVAADGTSSALTNITALLEDAIGDPTVDLTRALLVNFHGVSRARPTTVGTAMQYTAAIFQAPETLDVDDVDPGFAASTARYAWWGLNSRSIIPGTHLRSVTATTFENETDPIAMSLRSRGKRRMHAPGEALWLAENVNLAGLTDRTWTFGITVEYP